MKKQRPYELRDFENDEELVAFDKKFRDSENLEYTVLLGHILIEHHLKDLIWARLGTDTMPDITGFELITSLALAGTDCAELRQRVDYLNGARTAVGHKFGRSDFEPQIKNFVAACNEKTISELEWPEDEGKKERGVA